MYSNEPLIAPGCPYYFHAPLERAKKLFFYPTILGKFHYLPGYKKTRKRFESFLIMLVEKGTMYIKLSSEEMKHAPEGSVIVINCYEPHEYGTEDGATVTWMHFDGVLAKEYFDEITKNSGQVIATPNYYSIKYAMNNLVSDFEKGAVTDEALLSLRITGILHFLFSSKQNDTNNTEEAVHEAVSYINSHFPEDISLKKLADIAALSPYYFTRAFKKETGLTPHQFVIATRISSAKYYLSTTRMTVSEIAYAVGFKDESSFCLTFRKREGLTPKAYRNKSAPTGQ